jgi:signal transduction histidine kinase
MTQLDGAPDVQGFSPPGAGPCRAEAGVLGKLLVIQGILDAVPDRGAQAEFLCTALREVPGVARAHVCFRGSVIPPHPECRAPCFLARSGRETSDDVTPCCRSSAFPDMRRILVATTETLYGFVIVALDGADAFAPYAPHVANLANFFAVMLEKREVSRHLNEMRRDLEEQVVQRTAELARKNASLAREIEHRRSVEDALRRAHDELELRVRERTAELVQTEDALKQAHRRKDEFLAMLAHELRNPLAPIRHAVQILRMQGAALAESRWSIEMIDRQVDHLARLVDDLLDVSRITEGKITLQREPVEVRAIIARAVEASRPAIDTHKHRLVVSDPPVGLRVDGDVVRLTQAVANLLNNAAKYTPTGGRISLSADADRERVVLRVTDTGVGIPADVLPYVFDLFMQAHQSLDRSTGGLGIGLTLVKRLVEMHGGSVTATSEGPGRGSEFVVTLPRLAEERPSPAAVAPDVPVAAACCRILVVDDNLDAADSLAMLLNLGGHETRVAPDGPTALGIAPTFRPHAVFLDIGLPGMDGYEVARRLRQESATARSVLVAITGYGQHEDRRRSEAAGFDHHLVKPVEWDALQSVLQCVK